MAQDDFFEQVWQVAALIPPGRVCSYGVIARYLGAVRSARMVGWAMNAADKAPFPIPAHRVVNRQGVLSGKHFFGDPNRMQALLEAEGVEVKDDQIVHLQKHFWDPAEELSLD